MARKGTAVQEAAAAPEETAFLDEAEHLSVREFRKHLAMLCRRKRVLVVGRASAPCGVFIPLQFDRWPVHEEVLAAARRAIRKVKTIERYHAETE
jgi:hypothetical protein